MLCNICNKNQATVHLTEIVDDQMSELHLCDECARKKSMQMEQQFGLSDLLAGLVDFGKQPGGAEKETQVSQCPACGLTYDDFRKIGRLGCSECYTAFAKFLGPLLKRIHGASIHAGKLPPQFSKPVILKAQKTKDAEPGVAELKAMLQQAIEKEEFEEAARLRDRIKELESLKKDGEKKETKKKGQSKKDDI